MSASRQAEWEKNYQDVLDSVLRRAKKKGLKGMELEIQAITKSVFENLREQYLSLTEKQFNSEYRTLGIGVEMQDKVALQLLKENHLRNQALIGLEDDVAEKINKAIIEAIRKNYTLAQTTELIKEGLQTTWGRAELIARNETFHIKNTAREKAWSKIAGRREEEFEYKWIGVNDRRTTKICQELHRTTAKGMSLNDLKEEIEKVAKENGMENWYTPERPWTPHPNCRGTLLRIVR